MSIVGGVSAAIFTLIILESISTQILLLTANIIVVCGLSANIRYKHFGITDPLLLFIICFMVYNGFLLLQVGLEMNVGKPVTLNYPIVFDEGTFLYAAFLSFIASLGIFCGTLLSINSKPLRIGPVRPKYGNAFFISGVIFLGIGMVLFFADFQRIGGFFYAISLPRGVRGLLMSQARGNLPYAPLVMSGLASLWLGYFLSSSQRKRMVVSVVLISWLALMLVLGDRRFLTYSLILVLGLYGSIKKNSWHIKFKPKLVLTIVLLYITFMVFAQTRWLLVPVVRGEISISEAVSWLINNTSYRWLLPGVNEFAGPYFTLLSSISHPVNPLYGRSYLNAIPNLLPRSLYPGEKPPTIAQTFARDIYESYFSTLESIIGWGYSPVAEAFNNFGLLGIPVVFVLLTLLWAWVGQLRRYGVLGLLIFSLLLPQTLNINRIDFSSSFMEAIYFTGAGLLNYIMAISLVKFR